MRPKKIFIVDDDHVTLAYLKHILHEVRGFDVETFTNARACLINLEQEPDLVIIDSVFHKTHKGDKIANGADLLERILIRRPEMPIIALSGKNDQNNIYKFIVRGARNYITKEGNYIPELLNAIDEELEIEELYKSISQMSIFK